MFRLTGLDDIRVFDWIKKKIDKYTCPDVQNEMLDVVSNIKSSLIFKMHYFMQLWLMKQITVHTRSR